MKVSNLSINQEIKNYKILCELLEEKIKTGESKQCQLREMERFFKYHRSGNKFIIDEIYIEPKQKIDNRGGSHNITDYIQTIELLILDLLVQDKNNGKVFLSKNRLMEELKMINKNYRFCKNNNRIPKLSQYLNIEKETVEEWYLSTSDMFKRNIESALKNLEKQSLVRWSSKITICELIPVAFNERQQNFSIDKSIHTNEFGEELSIYTIDNTLQESHREATDEEEQFILFVEREYIKNLGCQNKQQIIKIGLWKEFKDKVNEKVLKNLNAAYYYDSYKILFNEEHIYERVEELLDLLLEDKERLNHQNFLNDKIIKRLRNNIEKKQNRALEKKNKWIGLCPDEKINRRSKKAYIDDNNNLIDHLIDIKAKTIKNKIKKIKLE